MSAKHLFPRLKGGEIELATLWKMELQHYGKITCNFQEKVLAKNTLEFYRWKNRLITPINYTGYDKNELWKPIHNKITKYGKEKHIVANFEYVDVIKYFSQYYVPGINLLFLQYVISYFYNTGQIKKISIFFDDLIDSIVSKRDEKENFTIIINDVNSCYRGRDYFEDLVKKLKQNNFHGRVTSKYFNYKIKNRFQRYGEHYNSIQILHNMPETLRNTYNSAIYCSSAQLIIEVTG